MHTPVTELVPALNQSLEISLPASVTYEELREKLAAHFNQLIHSDFEKLVFLLYRIDVNEARMRALLAQRDGEDAPGLIADLVIERQLQKMESRKKFSGKDMDSKEEKW